MSKYVIDSKTLTDIADAIRDKEQSQNDILVSDYATRVEALPVGAGIGEYIDLNPQQVGESSTPWWQNKMALQPMADVEINVNTNRFDYIFQNCKWQYIPKVKTNGTINDLWLSYAFSGCSSVTSLDLSGISGTVGRFNYVFSGCTSLKHIDIRNLILHDNAWYSSALNNVPSNCEIIVKDATEKAWFNSNFSNYTNVKTVSEYEGG